MQREVLSAYKRFSWNSVIFMYTLNHALKGNREFTDGASAILRGLLFHLEPNEDRMP